VLLRPRTHIFGQEHFIDVDVVLLIAQDGGLIEYGEAVVSGIAALPQDDLAQRCHQILLAPTSKVLLSH
jgi:hypothetical protein